MDAAAAAVASADADARRLPSLQFVTRGTYCGNLIVSSGGDGAVRLWDEFGKPLGSLPLGGEAPPSAAEQEKLDEEKEEKEEEEGADEGEEEEAEAPGPRAVVTVATYAAEGLVAAAVEGSPEVHLLKVADEGITQVQTVPLTEVCA